MCEIMKECPKCGKENLDEAKFCTGCSFDLRDVTPKGQGKGNRLKLIGVLIVLIIIVLCVGLFFTMNNNTQVSSDVNNSDGNTVNEEITSDNVNTTNGEYETMDFNGLFTMNLPKEYTLQVVEDPNLNAKYAWHIWDGLSTYSDVYYYEGYNDLNDVLNQFPAHNVEREGNLVLFKYDGNYYVGVESNNNEFVVMSTDLNGYLLDNYKQSANSIVFK